MKTICHTLLDVQTHRPSHMVAGQCKNPVLYVPVCLTADVSLPLVWVDSHFLLRHSERLSLSQGSIMLLEQKMTTFLLLAR